jgi:predicted metalloendopeptidase
LPRCIRSTSPRTRRDPQRYVATVHQAGLGLPDRDYYLNDDDARLKAIRGEYVEHVSRMLGLAGVAAPAQAAQQVLAVEVRLARAQWSRVENRDPVRTYNKVTIAELEALSPRYPWRGWLAATKLAGRIDALVVSQPSYLASLGETLEAMPLDAWKAYFKYHLVRAYAPYLSKPFVDENFAFAGTALSGTPRNLPRWKRGVALVEGALGEDLGRLYVARHFLPQDKARVEALVDNLLRAFRQSIDELDWMGAQTKQEARAKLAKLRPKIAYPSRWRDYAALRVERDDLVGNVTRARRFEYERALAKLGRPIDREEWSIPPQTVNAYYSRLGNEIVFPAAILQPPFFDAAADDAANYGGIGAIIGHEISHGFDDSGSQADGDGRLRNWWTDDDRQRFNAKTKALVAQYSAFEVVPGYRVNGALTLGENIADNAGLAVAYKAYRLSLGGRPAPVVDGLSGDARFFRGFAAVWRNKTREQQAIVLVKTDPHAPGEFRANGSLRNQAAFHSVFGVGPGDRMYLPPEQRVTIW